MRCVYFLTHRIIFVEYILKGRDYRNMVAYFLGANSAKGFHSCYDSFCKAEEGNFLWVIKGGPGCGKSTFMRRIGAAAEEKGLAVEYVYCSGDPDSLDGVYIPEKKLGYVDGTAPHIQEPLFPGAGGAYLDLGKFYDRDALRGSLHDIIRVNGAYKSLYAKAYAILAQYKNETELPKAPAQLPCRFHTAISCFGIFMLPIPGEIHMVTPQELANILPSADETAVVYLHPLWPDTAVGVRENDVTYCADVQLPDLIGVTYLLKQAKSLHDDLEKIYNPHVDFASVNILAREHIEKYL